MAEKVVVDNKRTGVKASRIPTEFPPCYYSDKNRLMGPLGAFLERIPEMDGSNWILCCPGCGEAGGPRQGSKWTVEKGSFQDISTLTLSPSIACNGCCGWHGYLKNGVFESC